MVRKDTSFVLGVLAIGLLLFTSACDTVGTDSDLTSKDIDEVTPIKNIDESSFSTQTQETVVELSEKLAVRYVNERKPQQTEIPQSVISYFKNALLHLYNSDLEEAKTVTQEYTLMVGAPVNAREVLLWANETEPWITNWRDGKTETGVSEIDELIQRFELSLSDYREYANTSSEVMAKMEAAHATNVYAVGELFTEIGEIERAGPDGLIVGGRDIKPTIQDDYVLLDVTVGSGDCPSGCINKINHKFKVSVDGQVSLVD